MNRPGIVGSRLLAQLDAEIRKTFHPVDNACLRAERAGQLARYGRVDEARDEVAALQALHLRQPHAAVSAWLCLAEGCILHCASLSDGARDRMQRAQALSSATQLQRLQGLSAAWLAHLDGLRLDPESMACQLQRALALADPQRPGALARACLAAAVAWHFAERLDRARPWYARARECASLEGDEATLGAIVREMAWLRSRHAVQAALFGGPVDEHARCALAGADASENFGAWIGTTALSARVPLMRAAVRSVQGDAAGAIALYERHWPEARRSGLGGLAASVLADLATCRWALGQRDQALAEAGQAARAIDPSMQSDDQAVAHARLLRLYREAGHPELALPHEAGARECWARHRRLQQAFLAVLAPLPPAPAPRCSAVPAMQREGRLPERAFHPGLSADMGARAGRFRTAPC